ncbi:translocation/assembly module TamB domain-containing protein [Massilia sp. GCM10020059]|uniref:Translocation/assembly module TamB domain-containing protein n=1 Tax=Massilia agrisoli TaxID=2892444 RepID=A0ABS8IM37_9BURK|nr:translocation/assembly module TamB domain-containing protein [Massilia agrisoli]MCC6069509.1 translocation/assembly module TamB domain-containing protein [Massilia agrisoli]
MTTEETTPPQAPAPHKRRWPRYVAIGLGATGVLLAGAYWYLGRETTLQMLAQRVASASGGSIVITGVRGSLYGAMQMDSLVYRSPEQLITAKKLDIDWSPWQYLSSGIAISKLHVASVQVDTLRESEEPAKMPVSLAPPFTLSIADARVARLTMNNAGAKTVIDDVRFKLNGDKQKWELRDATALTPWGKAAASGSIESTRPFKLDAAATLVQTGAKAGQTPAQLSVRAGGDLVSTQVNAAGQAGKAVGDMKLTLAPFEPVPLRALDLQGRNINPGFFNPALPAADLSMAVKAKIDPAKAISGAVDIANDGKVGPLDKQLLPLLSMRGRLGGTLAAMQIDDVLVDLGAAGKFTGGGAVQRGPDEKGIGGAQFKLHTDRINLKALYSTMKATAIAGDIQLASTGDIQTFGAQLSQRGMRLDAQATLAKQVLDIKRARLTAGSGHLDLAGSASLEGKREFKVGATAVHFNPAALGDFPAADINALVNASGALSPALRVSSDFTLRPSRLFGQPLSGKGKFSADAEHVTGVDASFAMGQNTVDLRGSFGAPGERLLWKLDARQLSALRAGLTGALAANGVVSGTMEAPRTTFVADARGLGFARKAGKANNSVLHASGEAWLAAGDINLKTSGTARGFDPAAFGSPLAGSINGKFDANGRLAKNWSGSAGIVLEPSTLSNAPLWGHARLGGSAQRISSADVDLHVGPNVIAAKGQFGAPADRLDWRIDAPQLAVLGGDFGGLLRGSGTLSGTAQAPALTAALEGQNVKVLGRHQVRALRASANIGARQGGATPMVSNVEITGYTSGDTSIDSARLQTTGTRAAHTLSLAARGEAFDAAVQARGGWNGDAWSGVLESLQNRGRYAMSLARPVPLRLAVAPGAGAMGLARPQQIAFNGAVIALPAGTINIASLVKDGSRWSSKGTATGVPLSYLAQFSPALQDNMRGDLALGGEWGLDLQAAGAAGGAPQLAGMVHVFRERGDLIVGSQVPVVLGLRTLDLRADVAGGALRTRVNVDGAKAGVARIDATTQLLNGRLGTGSPLRLSANADMASIAWMAPLLAQPGLELNGAMKLAVTGAGTIGSPTLNGTVSGDNLAVRWPEQGVRLRNGQLRAQLAGDQMLLQRLSFDGVQGNAVADGAIRFAGGEATMQLKLVANKLEALSRPDRTVVVTGTGTVNRTATSFNVDGKFRVDRALVELAPQGRPTMSDDVIVLGRTSAAAKAREKAAIPLEADVEIDMGDAFRLRGMGADAELAGTVRVRTGDNRAPRVNGTIRAVNGTYAAYGQKLAIERGILTFSGRYDNPALNIRAVRKRPEGEQLSETNVEAGVEVRGTALAPVAKLVSTPSVPDSEKLSWLVLGHGMEGVSGNEAGLLSAAAGALLGGSGGSGGFQSRLKDSLGVDELGVSQAKGLESTVVTIGKRLSSRAYLSFEQGATSASSLVRIRYKLNPRVTLQFQTGTNTALDVLYSWAFD